MGFRVQILDDVIQRQIIESVFSFCYSDDFEIYIYICLRNGIQLCITMKLVVTV